MGEFKVKEGFMGFWNKKVEIKYKRCTSENLKTCRCLNGYSSVIEYYMSLLSSDIGMTFPYQQLHFK